MKQHTTHYLNQTRGKIQLALALIAGVALAGLTGCGQSSSASTPSADPVPATQQTATGTAAEAAPTAPSADHGKQLFTATCTGCHGNQGQGIPHLGKDLHHSQFATGLSDAQLTDFITQGRAANDPLNTTHVPMPPKGGNPALSPQDISDIVAFLRQLQTNSAPAK